MDGTVHPTVTTAQLGFWSALSVTLLLVVFPFSLVIDSLLAAAPVFTSGRLEAWIKWLLILNGVLFAIPTMILPALTLPTNATGTGIGNQVGMVANMIWSFYISIPAVLLAVLFKRLQNAIRWPRAP